MANYYKGCGHSKRNQAPQFLKWNKCFDCTKRDNDRRLIGDPNYKPPVGQLVLTTQLRYEWVCPVEARWKP